MCGFISSLFRKKRKTARRAAVLMLLVADEEGLVGDAFGVETYSPTGLYKRQTFLVVDGEIVWRDLSAAPGTQAEDALQAYRDVIEEY